LNELIVLKRFNRTRFSNTLFIIRSARKTFDTSETQKEIGPIIVQFGKVQSKVTLKYDSWHKDVLSRFGGMLSNEMTEFHSHIQKSRSELEQQSIDTANTSEAVGLITQVQALKRKMKNWEKQVDVSVWFLPFIKPIRVFCRFTTELL
jgi:dynein heavy chain 1